MFIPVPGTTSVKRFLLQISLFCLLQLGSSSVTWGAGGQGDSKRGTSPRHQLRRGARIASHPCGICALAARAALVHGHPAPDCFKSKNQGRQNMQLPPSTSSQNLCPSRMQTLCVTSLVVLDRRMICSMCRFTLQYKLMPMQV